MFALIIMMTLLLTLTTNAQTAASISAADIKEQMQYRIVSFHQGRADKNLIRRAAELGFNGVQFQLEGNSINSFKDFAERDRKEGYIDLCHKLGMKVTVWTHEFSAIPGKDKPDYPGTVELGNEKFWKYIEDRYEWILGELVPDIDGLVLTVVETQIKATNTDIMLQLVDIIRGKCLKYNKQLIVRTFVWHPEDLEGVMGCVKQLPEDVVIMTKCVPQDWQLRGIHDKTIGNVGNHTQLVEYDIAGEYFLMDSAANCMPSLLKTHFDYGLKHGVDGICLRVDRFNMKILHEPQEVNLWTLGMLATGKTDNVEDAWNAWAVARYGRDAAPGVIRALKPTLQVMTECLNIGSFSFGDTRGFPPNPDKDAFLTNWANFRWDASYLYEYKLGLTGDPGYTRKIEAQKYNAKRLAQQCLDDLELVKGKLVQADYEILKTKLLSNKVHLEWRAPIMLAYLHYRRLLSTKDQEEKQQLAQKIQKELKAIVSAAGKIYPPKQEIEHLGQKWSVGAPLNFDPKKIVEWTKKMEALVSAQGLTIKLVD